MEWGAILGRQALKNNSLSSLIQLSDSAQWLCGHNIVAHDLQVIKKQSPTTQLLQLPYIDTLLWSPLLFPKEKYHRLVKDYQLQGDWINDPIKDSQEAKKLFEQLLEEWNKLSINKQKLFHYLLHQQATYQGWFDFLNFNNPTASIVTIELTIREYLNPKICHSRPLKHYIENHPTELAYALAIIDADPENTGFIAPWVLQQYPLVEHIIKELRQACAGRLCSSKFCLEQSAEAGLQHYFGFPSFRKYGEQDLQKNAVETALYGDSLLAVFPTGGGKSLTFQLPALMTGRACKALTIVISPLQSLMKDQVDVLQGRHEIVEAVAINGLLSPLERQEAFDRVYKGDISLLYISPESLRSRRMLNLLASRVIDRFVIDEAHCFSSWGQDFRVDYLYIANFIRKLQKIKGIASIPVSCFTATAKPAVIEDIQNYFKQQLDVDLKLFVTSTSRSNLSYHVIPVEDEPQKNNELLELLTIKQCPTIIYVSRTRQAEELAKFLQKSGFEAFSFHGKMDRNEKIKVMDAFMAKDSGMDIVVATSAFGMGVDKDNVEMVIHYSISDSLENYVQEAGRAGRDPNLEADCYVLFNINDLDQHFLLLNSTRISKKEINQIWQGIKRFGRNQFIKSAREIAKTAGWDVDMYELETRVKSAIAALEQAQYIKREENRPKIFADSLAISSVEQASQQIKKKISDPDEQQLADRMISHIISRARSIDINSIDIDEVSDSLAISREKTMLMVRKLKEIGLLREDKDLSAYVNISKGKKGSFSIYKQKSMIEAALAELLFANRDSKIQNRSFRFNLREINEELFSQGIESHTADIKQILNYWQILSAIEKERLDSAKGIYRIRLKRKWNHFNSEIQQREKLASYVLTQLWTDAKGLAKNKEQQVLVEFSLNGLKKAVQGSFRGQHDSAFYEQVLLQLQHLGAIELSKGFIVYYNPMRIIRLEENNHKQFTNADYEGLGNFYQHKTEQIHIVGEYAKRYLTQQAQALEFVHDYFALDYSAFLKKYFRHLDQEKIKRPITDEKFRQIVEKLSPEQMQVFHAKANRILVAAGPGSGKTKLLVHKVAALLLIEEVKPEQLLMLTFSRPAALEFKYRLQQLTGPIAYGVDIHTYHGFAFQLMGRMGDLERSATVLQDAKKAILNEEVALDRILSKSVIVVDEYQDVSKDEYELLMAIAEKAHPVSIIAVGDDDQNIYEFRGANIEYMHRFKAEKEALLFFLTLNFRSAPNIVAFNNAYLQQVMHTSQRIKQSQPLQATKKENGLLHVHTYHATESLFMPVVNDIEQRFKKGDLKEQTTAILCYTNEEALMLYALLQEAGIPARLIAGQDEFRLSQLLELRIFQYFIEQQADQEDGLIEHGHWLDAVAKLKENQKNSTNLKLALRIIHSFERAQDKLYRVAWRSYLGEIQLQDFFSPDKKVVLISTMHKAKGKEFDQVWLMLNKQYPLASEEKKRVLYVALTRAKAGLHIHSNHSLFKTFAPKVQALNYHQHPENYPLPNKIIHLCSMKDVNLGYFKHFTIQEHIKLIQAGQEMTIDTAGFFFANQQRVGKLSKRGQDFIQEYQQKGYEITAVRTGYIVLWHEPEKVEEHRVVLPVVEMEREL